MAIVPSFADYSTCIAHGIQGFQLYRAMLPYPQMDIRFTVTSDNGTAAGQKTCGSIFVKRKRKNTVRIRCFGGGWWIRTTEVDRQQIYSLSPLATREIPHMELVIGVEPTTC